MRRVVITGIGAVSPNGIGRERFWEATRNGVSGVSRITRFDPSAYQVQVAGQVSDEFDEKKYVEIKDRPHVSRAVPLAAASVAEAVADAGLDVNAMSRDELRGIGVIVGSGGGSQDFTEEQYRLFYAGLIKQCSVYTIPTGTIGTLASEVSMRFGFRGMSHIVSTGCTSSTDAMGYAYRNIQAGVLDTMVTGGVDSPIAPLILRGFQLMRIMSTSWNSEPTRASRPFSKDRDGFVLAEGSWFFVMEEMERAKARGAQIYGEVAGYGSTCEAFHRVRLEECGEEPARAIGMALKEGGIAPADVQYINYHGTSTELNDRTLRDIAASFQVACVDVIVKKLDRAVRRTRARSVIIGGGVSANRGLRAALEDFRIPVFFPPMCYCTDNAAMSAGLADVLLGEGQVAPLDLDAITYSRLT